MLKTVTLTVDDVEFSTTQFPAMKALEVMVSLQRLATANVSPNAQISQAAPALMSGLDGASAKKLVLDLLQCTTALVRDPAPKLIQLTSQQAIDQVFSGKLKVLFQVIGHAIEVNYGDFNEGSPDPAPLHPTLDQ